MALNNDVPDRCYSCRNCVYDRHLEYYPYWVCKLANKEIHFNSDNGHERMIWCPLAKERKEP